MIIYKIFNFSVLKETSHNEKEIILQQKLLNQVFLLAYLFPFLIPF